VIAPSERFVVWSPAPLGAPAPIEAPTTKKSRAGLVVGLLVVLVLIVGGGVAGFFVLGGSSSAKLTVDSCEIASDGTLTATGTVADGGDTTVEVGVTFIEVSSGDKVDDETVPVRLLDGSGGWSAIGAAGDSVTRVTCEATLGN